VKSLTCEKVKITLTKMLKNHLPDTPEHSETQQPHQSHQFEPNLTKASNNAKKRKNQPSLILIGSFLLLMAVGGGGIWFFTQQGQKNPPAFAGQTQAFPVKLLTLKTSTLQTSSEVVGTLDTDKATVLKTESEGRIGRILVKEGDLVQAGQVIITLEKDDLEAELLQTKARLAHAKAQLAKLEGGNRPEDIAEAKAQLSEAKSRLSDAKKGAKPEEIAQAAAKLDAAKAEADLAQDRVNRYDKLREEGAISEDEFQSLLQRQRSTNAAVQEAERRLAEVKKSRDSDIDELAAQVEKWQQNLNRLENGARIEDIAQAKAEVAGAIAEVRMIEVKINKTQVTAPISGQIGDIPVKLGDYLETGDELTTITDNNSLRINLNIPVEKASELRLGLPVEIIDQQGKVFAQGEISFISPAVNPNLQQVLAKATINNLSGELLNQQFVKTNIIWEQLPGVLVPAAAISRLGGETYVFVAEKSPNSPKDKPQLIAQQRPVKLGGLQGNDYQILAGVKAGETIITAGIIQLQDGTPIQPLP
jgi:RND family efflux transporter MFP subunit